MLIPLALADSISIHAAREGGDVSKPPVAHFRNISIHAAREGGDLLQRRLQCMSV